MGITQIEKKEKIRGRENTHTVAEGKRKQLVATSPFPGTVMASNWRRMARREEGPKILYVL
jgi:hypothetical protein